MEFWLVFSLLLLVTLIVVITLWRKTSYQLNDQLINLDTLQHKLTVTQGRLDALQSSLGTVADTMYDALLVIESDFRIAIINRAAREIFNVKETSVGQTLMMVTRNHELDAMARGIIRGETFLENQIEIREQTYRVRSAPISLFGRTSAILVLQNISELLRLTRARREMVANFSHDMRTPVSSIRLLVDTLITNYGKNPERDRKSISKIGGEIDSLQHMMQELIDLSMIESGKAMIRMVPVKFVDVVNDALRIMETQLDQKKLQLTRDIPDTLEVLIDPEQTRRVIMNILHNAIKFTPSGGNIHFSATCDTMMATVRIKDTGIGIPPQDRTRIFERFYQVDSSRTTQSGNTGSGLGLAIAKHIIEAQGGTIWAEANLPAGACIVFTIPLAESALAK